MVPEGKGRIAGTLDENRHRAVVDIRYNLHDYSILYRDSRNLKNSGYHIHHDYNRWITKLNEHIRKESENWAHWASSLPRKERVNGKLEGQAA